MTGSLQVMGNVGTITISLSLNAQNPTDQLVITGNLTSLTVGTANTVAIHTLNLPVSVQGDLGTLTVNGRMLSALSVGGTLRTVTIGVDVAEAGVDLLTGNITVGDSLTSLTLNNGNLAADVVTGRNIGTVNLRNGNINTGAVIASLYGNVQSVSVTGGAMNGEIRAAMGKVSTLTTTGPGADFGGILAAQSAGTVTIAGNLLGTGMIDVDRDLSSLTVQGSVLSGADIEAGSLRTFNVTGNLAGDLDVGLMGITTLSLTVGGNWTPAPGTVQIDSDATITVRGTLGVVGTPAVISLGRTLTTMNVTGQAIMHLLVDRHIGNLTVGSLRDSVITSGFDMTSLTINGLMQNSLIQAGISRGDDGVFATTLAGLDEGETSRLATIGRMSTKGMASSIVASGGNLTNFTSSASVTDSSISSGLVLGSVNIATVLADGTPLASAGERNTARRGNGAATDLMLYRSDLANLSLTAPAARG
ncbi:MAG: hypothetical protein HC898_05860 [Phycisphaerales bacterium]|nr:hypothetical protein [Phycisphaerales bacterium]